MVEFDLRVHPEQRVTWLPRQLVKAWGFELKLLPNNCAGILYPKETEYDVVIRSAEILLLDLRLRAETTKKVKIGLAEKAAMHERTEGANRARTGRVLQRDEWAGRHG